MRATTLVSALVSALLPFTLADLTPRQNLGQVPGAVLTAPTQVSPVTTYMINAPGGGAAQIPVTYTQLFSKFPGQLPSPGVGSIGLGTLATSATPVAATTAAAAAAVKRTDAPRVVQTGIAGRIPHTFSR